MSKNLNTNITFDMLPRHPDTGRMFGLILTGSPGTGKTHAAMAMVNPERGEKLVRFAVAGKTKEDMVTYPVPDRVDGVLQITQVITESMIIPLLKQNIGDGFGLLLIDDVTGGDPSLQTALLEMVQFGRIGEHELGKNVAIALTGNGVEDSANAVPWNTALMGRCVTIKYFPDFEKWSNLEDNKRVDPVVMSFLQDNKEWFAPSGGDTDADKYFDDLNRGPQPRLWTTLGNHLHEKWGGARNFEPNILFPSLQSFVESMVGERAAVSFMTYANTMLEYPHASEILEDPSKWTSLSAEKRNNKGGVYAVAHSLRHHAIMKNESIIAEHGKSKKAEGLQKDLIVKLSLATEALSASDRAISAFIARYVLQKGDDNIGAYLAEIAYQINDDPVLMKGRFNEDVIKDIKKMSMVQ